MICIQIWSTKNLGTIQYLRFVYRALYANAEVYFFHSILAEKSSRFAADKTQVYDGS